MPQPQQTIGRHRSLYSDTTGTPGPSDDLRVGRSSPASDSPHVEVLLAKTLNPKNLPNGPGSALRRQLPVGVCVCVCMNVRHRPSDLGTVKEVKRYASASHLPFANLFAPET